MPNIFEAGDRIKNDDRELRRAAAVSALVYEERDKQRMLVELGGSSVNNLADDAQLFGLAPGSTNAFASTYTVFGNLVRSQYPQLLSSFDPVSEVIDPSYLKVLLAKGPTTSAETVSFSRDGRMKQVVSRRAWDIQFQTGSAGFDPAVSKELAFALAYATVIPIVRPFVQGASKLRFLGLTGLVFAFTFATGGGFALEVALLAFGMSTFLVTSLARIVAEVPRSRLDHVRSLGATEARVVWGAVVRGTLDRSIDAVRQNVAMGWSMIPMVEGIARSDGGIGALLLAENKHFRLAEFYAVPVVGLAIDLAMRALGALACPHARHETREE